MTSIRPNETSESRRRLGNAVAVGERVARDGSGSTISTWEILDRISTEAGVTVRDAQLATFELIDRGEVEINEDFSLILLAPKGEASD
jgi:hypothetical protein